MTVLSKNLKRLRVAKNMTQEQAAEALGISTQTVSRWECNTTLPDVTMLPAIASLYCVTIDDLYWETSMAYDNYAHRMGAVFEASRKPEDYLRADLEYQKLLRSDEYTMEDLRLYGILNQQMMRLCRERAEELFNRAIQFGPEEDSDTYWAVQRQKGYFLWEIGRNQENIDAFLPMVQAGSDEIQIWICLIQAFTLERNYDVAWNWAQKAAQRFPENAMLHIYSGDLLRAMKRYDEAFVHWERALEMEPEWCDAAYSMAYCYEELEDYGKAYQVYSKIAADLEHRGFESEVNWPRTLADQCRKKMRA